MSLSRKAKEGAPLSLGKTVVKDEHELRQEVHSDDLSLTDQQPSEIGATESDPAGSIRHHGSSNSAVVQVRHCEPRDLFQLRQFTGLPRIALGGFLNRYRESDWMQRQDFYVQTAAIAAAHESMPRVLSNGAEIFRPLNSEFDGIGLLNCGMRIRPRPGQPPVWICNQIEHCKRCNLWQRVNPAKAEFLPAFNRAEKWHSVMVMGRSDPTQAGVKVEIDRDKDDQPVYEWRFRLSDHGRFAKLPKFGVNDPSLSNIVSEGLYDFINWMTDGSYFNGLHAFRDISFSFFPDPGKEIGVSHTVNCHYHAYGNTSRPFTPKEAQRMWLACDRLLIKSGDDRRFVYPYITLRPRPTVDSLKSAINYVIKPFKLAAFYIKGLEHGSPIAGLNYEFYQTAFESESLLFGPPQGYAFGNMSQKSRRHYIGVPRPKAMSRKQVERFLEKVDNDEAHAWEIERYHSYLELLRCQKPRKMKQSLI